MDLFSNVLIYRILMVALVGQILSITSAACWISIFNFVY